MRRLAAGLPLLSLSLTGKAALLDLTTHWIGNLSLTIFLIAMLIVAVSPSES